MTYALLVDGLDSDQRDKFDRDLNGYGEKDKRVIADLLGVSGIGGA